MRDATTSLLAAISMYFVTFELREIRSRSWASATFSGVRHELTLRVSGAEADAFLDGLEEREFKIRGHILADIVLVEKRIEADGVSLRLEALTIEES